MARDYVGYILFKGLARLAMRTTAMIRQIRVIYRELRDSAILAIGA
jgi:hypothetical protein